MRRSNDRGIHPSKPWEDFRRNQHQHLAMRNVIALVLPGVLWSPDLAVTLQEKQHPGMSATFVCSLLVLAAPAVQALGVGAAHGGARPARQLQAAAHVQPGDAAGDPLQPIGRRSTRDLLTRQLQSRTSKSRTRRPRKARTERKSGDSHKKKSRPPKKHHRSDRGSKKGSKKGSSRKVKSGDNDDDDPSLCAKHVVEKEIVRTKNAEAHVVASAHLPSHPPCCMQ